MTTRRTKVVAVVLLAIIALAYALRSPHGGTLALQTANIHTLYPHEHDPGDSVLSQSHHENAISNVVVTPRDLWVTSISGKMVNAPSNTLHHGELLRPDTMGTGSVCASAYGAGELLSFGQDHMYSPRIALPAGYALFIPKGVPLVLGVMLHNPLPPVGPGGTYRNVSARLALEEATSTQYLTPVTFRLLHLEREPCKTTENGYEFEVPAHAKDFVFGYPKGTAPDPASYTFERGATVVYMGAHIHGWEGGKELRVYKNGVLLTTFKTLKDAEDTYRYDTPHYATSLRMQAGDTLSIEAVYDNPYDVPLTGAMGMMGFYYAQE